MDNKLTNLIKFLRKLKENKFTGQIRLNFHKGNIASKIEKKVAITENDIAWTNASKSVNRSRRLVGALIIDRKPFKMENGVKPNDKVKSLADCVK